MTQFVEHATPGQFWVAQSPLPCGATPCLGLEQNEETSEVDQRWAKSLGRPGVQSPVPEYSRKVSQQWSLEVPSMLRLDGTPGKRLTEFLAWQPHARGPWFNFFWDGWDTGALSRKPDSGRSRTTFAATEVEAGYRLTFSSEIWLRGLPCGLGRKTML